MREKKLLERRVEQLEKTSNNWMNMNRQRAQQHDDVIKRSTMTNFARRTIIENNIRQESRGGSGAHAGVPGGAAKLNASNHSIAKSRIDPVPGTSAGASANQQTHNSMYSYPMSTDDYEPVRP